MIDNTFLRVVIPFLPPSSNNIYKNIPGRGRMLSSAASQFQLRSMRIIQQEGRAALLKLAQDVPYQLELIFYFDAIENAGWYETWTRGGKTGERKAATRFKRMDLSNRIKLLEDVVAKAIGLDDSHTFRLVVEKKLDAKNPRVEVGLTRLPELERTVLVRNGEKEDATRPRVHESEQHGVSSDLPKGGVSARPSRDQTGGPDTNPGRGGIYGLLRARPRR